MQLTDERDIAADPQTVWKALLDPDVLRQCIPGCQEMTGSPEEGYQAKVTQKVGPVKATFNGEVALTDVDEGRACKLNGQGKGGPAGFAKGSADVKLSPSETGTHLAYEVEAKVGGKLAQLGSRVIDGFAKKMADQFFDNFKSVVEGGKPPGETSPDEETMQAEATGGTTSQNVAPEGDAVAATGPAPEANAEPAPGGGAAPRAGEGKETTAPPASPDETQVSQEKKSWFRRLVGN